MSTEIGVISTQAAQVQVTPQPAAQPAAAVQATQAQTPPPPPPPVESGRGTQVDKTA